MLSSLKCLLLAYYQWILSEEFRSSLLTCSPVQRYHSADEDSTFQPVRKAA